jgi:prepilin-type N-terminal cleavage/methylation domain-containing protein
MTPRPASRRAAGGFTLMESIIVLVVLGIAAVAVQKLLGFVAADQTSISELQLRASIMQECAEELLAVRRNSSNAVTGYDAITSVAIGNNCGGITAPNGYMPNVTVTDPYTGAGCPANHACKTVSIQSGTANPLTLMFVDY